MSRFRRIVAAASAVIALAAAPAAAVAQTPAYSEPYRPQFHFTPAQNWMNDPNGMVYFEGEYHLFFQYNPFGDTWGHCPAPTRPAQGMARGLPAPLHRGTLGQDEQG